MDISLRMTEEHQQFLMAHLFPGDGKEAVAFAICGRATDGSREDILLVSEIIPVPYEHCSFRAENRVTWSSDVLPDILSKAEKYNWGVVKFHSHPEGGIHFSEYDDESDRALFPTIYSWLDSDLPHASVIATPSGVMVGRAVSREGAFRPVNSIRIVGAGIKEVTPEQSCGERDSPRFAKRVSQTFGERTFSKLQDLKVGIVGCSGTGSPVIEQLVRNGVGQLVLVDPDYIDEGNLNRITNSSIEDAEAKTPKVEMHRRSIAKIGIGTKIEAYHSDLFRSEVVRSLSSCDFVFGCMDSVDGRHLLNKLATYYLIPYIDIGVKLIADGKGGISQVCCQSHYLQPGKSSLFSRGVYTLEQLNAASLFRTDPETYLREKEEGYIDGVNVDKPAVVSINTLAASIAVNDFLARIHPYRRVCNSDIAVTRLTLTDMFMVTAPEGPQCNMLKSYVGNGDMPLLLNTPELSEIEVAA
jgi:hypothetical protein